MKLTRLERTKEKQDGRIYNNYTVNVQDDDELEQVYVPIVVDPTLRTTLEPDDHEPDVSVITIK